MYLHDGGGPDSDLREGWTVRYTTDLTPPVRYYVRGEEYSHQLDYFVESVRTRRRVTPYDFSSAHDTDIVLDMIKRDAAAGGRTAAAANGDPRDLGPRGEASVVSSHVDPPNAPEHSHGEALFGDNQFFGVNHMSEEKARAQAMRFQDIAAIIEVLDAAYDAGIRTFMCTTHDRIAEICDHVRANPERYPDFEFFPVHAVRPQVRERGDRARHARRTAEVPARDGQLDAAVRGGTSLADEGHRGLMTHARSTPR